MIKKFKLFEEFNREDIQDYAISINSGNDAFEVTGVLLKLGFFPYSKTPEAARINYCSDYKYYEPMPTNYGENGYQMAPHTDFPIMSIEKFRELTEYINRLKRIEHPDDPYGEDDWGYYSK